MKYTQYNITVTPGGQMEWDQTDICPIHHWTVGARKQDTTLVTLIQGVETDTTLALPISVVEINTTVT